MPALAFPATPAPQLTNTLRTHLLQQYRDDLRHDERELENLTSAAIYDRRTDKRRTHRIGQLHTRIAGTREAIEELGEVV